jgi:hypothetical protein
LISWLHYQVFKAQRHQDRQAGDYLRKDIERGKIEGIWLFWLFLQLFRFRAVFPAALPCAGEGNAPLVRKDGLHAGRAPLPGHSCSDSGTLMTAHGNAGETDAKDWVPPLGGRFLPEPHFRFRRVGMSFEMCSGSIFRKTLLK